MPEVQKSFYTDMYFGSKYFSYTADELPEICKKWFNIPSERENTYIAGESMGGYGAVKIGMRRYKNFAGIASLSGVLDFRSFLDDLRNNIFEEMNTIELTALLGPASACSDKDDVIFLSKQIAKEKDRPKLIQICGTEDFLYEENAAFKTALDRAGYGHMYLEWPGEHAWPFWDVAIQRAIQFFCNLDMETTPIF